LVRLVLKITSMQNPEHLRPSEPDQPVILVAEDEILVQNIARITLEQEGYFVLTAPNGEVALYLSRQYPGQIDLLLTDVVMPQMSGVELSERISKERPGIQIVLMSGNSFAENINPKFPFLQKPFGPKELRETIKGLIPVRNGTRT
jgi:two-component system, cell cycle sensor histidine kinase and response regulator CckA